MTIYKYLYNIQIFLKFLVFIINVYFFKILNKELYAFFYFQLVLFKKVVICIYQYLYNKEKFSLKRYFPFYKNSQIIRLLIVLITEIIISWLWCQFIVLPSNIVKYHYKYLFLIFSTSIFNEYVFKSYGKSFFGVVPKWSQFLINDILLLSQHLTTFFIIFFKFLSPQYSLVSGYLLGYLLHFFIFKIFQQVIEYLNQNEVYHDESKYWVKDKQFKDSNFKNIFEDNKSLFIIKCIVTFTGQLSLFEQAVIAIIEKFGIFLSETLFEPTIRIGKKFLNTSLISFEVTDDSGIGIFKNVLKHFVLLGFILSIFISPYSYAVTKLVDSEFLIFNYGDRLLVIYINHLILLSINDILQYLNVYLLKRNKDTIYKKFYHYIFTITIIFYYFAFQYSRIMGLYIVNLLLTIIHITMNFYQIYSVEKKFLLPISTFMPSLNGLILLIFGYFATQLSFLIFAKADGMINSLTHISIGGVIFIVIIFHFVQNEFPKNNPIIFFQEKLHYQ